jgi:predicted AAA+ superfamily ATPase
LFLDEIQYTENWQTWIKHEVDFNKRRRIAVTGSAIPLNAENVESGVGRWHSIKLATLSFYEYLQIKKVRLPRIPEVGQLTKVIDWPKSKRIRAAEASRALIGHFHEYILRGGFPQTSIVESIPVAQKLLREDIVDKVLKRDMTALFGVRNVLELERTFLYLCLHDGGILDIASLSSNLRIGKPTAMNFINLLEAANLVYKLPPFGYGKEILRGRYKVYLADAAIAGSVLLKGKSLLEDAAKLGAAVETAFFKHVFARYYGASVSFSYWRSRKALEVDIVAEVGDELVPFEVKYERGKIGAADVKGLIEFCSERKPKRGYVITKDLNDFELLDNHAAPTQILKIPAPLACYWLSQSEPRP